MLKYCLRKWDKNKSKLEEALKNDGCLNSCDYLYLLKITVETIFNTGNEYSSEDWDIEKITQIDNGDYQGTLLFLIPSKTYQPSESEYLMTFVGYGSCSGCDTLLDIQSWHYEGLPTEQQLKDYMTLCRDMVCNIIKPYNSGWRNNEDFEQVEWED